MAKYVDDDIKVQQFQLKKWSNIYMESCRVGDEILYVLNRKKQQPRMGSLLQNPCLLMSKQFV